ncbi:E3 ubiquitin-protein ligase RNF187 [Neomonachus schauinslandi]|uniref:E3 ubiquitin-protein ligase RNF187 n=1 Tax=Neomonachus schauinslandi TaxID=29088 RepID=A0A8M1MQE9_NEOSC|nr:E3 ubiquitin-protein ligase RNF187 [Neomonachus schauinslandi]
MLGLTPLPDHYSTERCEDVGRPADGSVQGTAARTFRGELPGQDPGRVARAHPCQDLVWGAPLPGSKSVKHTSARTLRGAHRCQDPAWGAPPSPPRASPSPSLSPASALRPSPLSSASRARLARTPWSPSLRRVLGLARPPAAPSPRAPAAAALALPAGPAEAACALCQRAPREPVRADCGHRFCRACVVRFWAEEDGPFPCPECADDCWQLTSVSSQENKGSVEIMRKDLNDARDLHGQAESAAAVWKGHVMDRRKKALTDYKKLRAFFAEEEERFLQEADKEEGSPEDEDADPAERFGSLLQAVSELERRHRNLGLSMLLQ